MVWRAHFGPIPEGRVEVSIDEPIYRWLREQGTLHVPDAQAPERFSSRDFRPLSFVLGCSPSPAGRTHWIAERASHRGAPLHPGADQTARNFRRSGRHRHRERPAVQELKESLEQQTATSEILGVIASSPTDIQPVLDAVARECARVCGATDATILLSRRRCTSKSCSVMDRFPEVPSAGNRPIDRGSVLAERLSTARRSISMTSEQSQSDYSDVAELHERVSDNARAPRCCAKVFRSVRL